MAILQCANNNVKLSVIIPVFNVEAYLGDCLDSVIAALKGISAEIICVDDGSTDGSAKVLSRYSELAEKQGLKLVCLAQCNQGVASARNAALDIARGEWICFVDGDDVWAPWAARNFLKMTELVEGLDLVQLTGKRFPEKGVYPWITDGDNGDISGISIQDDRVLRNCNINRGFAKTCFRRDLIRRVRFENFRIGEDRLFLIETLLLAKKIATGVCDMYGYRMRQGSAIQEPISARTTKDTVQYISKMFAILETSGRIAERNVMRIYLNKIIEQVPYELHLLRGEERVDAWKYWRNSLYWFRNAVGPKTLRQRLILFVCAQRVNQWVVILFGVLPYWLKSKGLHR